MKRKSILVISLLLAITFIFSGCSKTNPEKQVEYIERQLANAKKLDGRLESNFEIGMQGMTFNGELNSDIKYDISDDFPEVDLKGEVDMGAFGGSPFRLFMNKDMGYMSAGGEEGVTSFTEADREDLWNNFNEAKNQQSKDLKLSRTVTKSYEDKMQLLTASYDVGNLNEQMKKAMEENSDLNPTGMPVEDYNLSINKLEIVYGLNSKKELSEIRGSMEMTMEVEGQTITIKYNFTFKINSIDQDVQFDVPQTLATPTDENEETPTTKKSALPSLFQ